MTHPRRASPTAAPGATPSGPDDVPRGGRVGGAAIPAPLPVARFSTDDVPAARERFDAYQAAISGVFALGPPGGGGGGRPAAYRAEGATWRLRPGLPCRSPARSRTAVAVARSWDGPVSAHAVFLYSAAKENPNKIK